jgi:quercetin dioxygenase-like cupin family protein
MTTVHPTDLELSEARLSGDDAARWRSATGHSPRTGAQASGSSMLEVPPGCRLPRHTDSAEEVVVVTSGVADVVVGDERATIAAGGIALVPQGVPHEVHNAGDEPLRFVAIYAGTDVVTRYERDVEPDGGRERDPLGG